MDTAPLNKWESDVKYIVNFFQLIPIKDDDIKIIARVLEEEMGKIAMIKNNKIQGE